MRRRAIIDIMARRWAWVLVGVAFVLLAVGGWVVLRQQKAHNNQKEGTTEPYTSPYQPSPTQAKQLRMSELSLTSPTFSNGGVIPKTYTCDGEDICPPLRISGVPENAKALALIMDDPDAPVGVWDHWVVFNIPPDVEEIPEGTEPSGVSGRNSWGREGYDGPCPPDREHRYFFRLYALDEPLALSSGSTKEEVLRAMEGHILAQAELMGRYDRAY
ncbi:MAG: hypothetical protein KatS3mg100_532 [Candidatus Parcubacteria bacterium]|nr:MAG: hypothetical protein KatS3mg100_532 [Candidatus Parcubacteria bacterium]